MTVSVRAVRSRWSASAILAHRRRILLGLYLALLTCICLADLSAQDISVVHQHSINDGLDQRTVWHIIRDGDGKFFVCTEEKIQIFNGHQFRYIPLANGLSINRGTEVVKVGDNEIYIGNRTTSNYLLNTRSEKWTTLPTPDDGHVYLPSSTGLYRTYNRSPGSRSWILERLSCVDDRISWEDITSYTQETAPEEILFRQESGLVTMDKDGMLRQFVNAAPIDSICCARQLLGWVHGKLFIQSGNLIKSYTSAEGWKLESQFGGSRVVLRVDDHGNGLLGTSSDERFINQTYLITADSVIHFKEIPYVKNTILDYQSSDYRQKILLATYNGLYLLKYNTGIEHIMSDTNYQEGDFARVIWWIKQARNGSIYFFRETQGLFKLTESGDTELLLPNDQYPELQSSNYFAHLYGDDRYIMIAGVLPSPCVNIYDTETGAYRSTLTDNAKFRDFYQLTDTTVLLIGSDDTTGIVAIYNTDLHQFRIRQASKSYGTRYYDIDDSDSDLYLATNTGAYVFSKQSVISSSDSIRMEQISDAPARSIHYDDSKLSVGGSGGGLYLYDLNDGSVDSLSTATGLVDDVIVTMKPSALGDLWMCTWRGIAIVDSNYVLKRNLRVHDGLSSNETNSQSLLFADGYAYIGTINGISKISISQPLINHEYMNLILEGVSYTQDGRIESKEISSADEIIVPYAIDQISLDFAPYDYISNATVNDFLNDHQFTLNGRAYPLSSSGMLTIPDLAHGESTITWYKRNRLGQLAVHQKLSIYRETIIDKYFTHIVVGTLFLLLLGYIWYIRKRRIEDQALSMKRKQTAQINELKLTALRSQMNPHFLFNALGSIQYYIQRNDSDIADEYLSDFATLMRGILDASVSDSIRLKDELALLELYVKMEQLRMDRQFQYRVEVSDDVDLSFPLPPMILQPFVENAILHGIFHLPTDDGYLQLSITELDEAKLQVLISDNGVGRQQSKELKNKMHISRATAIVDERLQLINLTQGNSFSYDIADNPTGRGTQVTLLFQID